jgi:hypothetical protein
MSETEKKPLFKRKIYLVLATILVPLLILEIATCIWLDFIAPEEVRLEYALCSYLSPDNQRYVRHQYLNNYPNPKYRRG